VKSYFNFCFFLLLHFVSFLRIAYFSHLFRSFQLSEPIEFDRYRAPIALTDVEPVDGQECTLAGWGIFSTEGIFPRILQKMNQFVMSLKKCQKHFKTSLTEGHTCAYNRYGVGACDVSNVHCWKSDGDTRQLLKILLVIKRVVDKNFLNVFLG